MVHPPLAAESVFSKNMGFRESKNRPVAKMCIRDSYFGLETLKLIVRSPLVLLGLEDKYDVVVRVSGGGVSGQAGAIRHGLSRALRQQSDENRTCLLYTSRCV